MKDKCCAVCDQDMPWPQPIMTLYTADGEVKIYANGVVEGLDAQGICNYLPLLLTPEEMAQFSRPFNVQI